MTIRYFCNGIRENKNNKSLAVYIGHFSFKTIHNEKNLFNGYLGMVCRHSIYRMYKN